MESRLIQLVVVWGSVFGFTGFADAQVALVAKPKLEKPVERKSARVFVPDAGFQRMRSKPLSSQQILALPNLNTVDRLCSKTKIEGAVEYDILHEGRSLKIVEKADGEIEVSMTRIFGPNDLDELRTSNPDLYMHARAFPKRSNGDQAVRFRVEVDVVYRSDNLSNLKKAHPKIYLIYDRFVLSPGKAPLLTVTPRIVIQNEEVEN